MFDFYGRQGRSSLHTVIQENFGCRPLRVFRKLVSAAVDSFHSTTHRQMAAKIVEIEPLRQLGASPSTCAVEIEPMTVELEPFDLL